MKAIINTMTHTIALAKNYGVIPALLILGALIGAVLPTVALADSNDRGERVKQMRVEVQFAGNGSALVRGAKVTSLSGSTLTAETIIGSTTATWTVKTGSTTEFVNDRGRSGSLSDILVGDIVSFQGPIDGGLFTVNARVVRDWSASSSAKANFKGVIASLATSTQSFSMNAGSDGTITVALASSTLVSDDGGSLLFANLKVGDEVKVSGSYDAATKTVTATKVIVKRDDDDEKMNGIWKIWKDKVKFNFNLRLKGDSDDD